MKLVTEVELDWKETDYKDSDAEFIGIFAERMRHSAEEIAKEMRANIRKLQTTISL